MLPCLGSEESICLSVKCDLMQFFSIVTALSADILQSEWPLGFPRLGYPWPPEVVISDLDRLHRDRVETTCLMILPTHVEQTWKKKLKLKTQITWLP